MNYLGRRRTIIKQRTEEAKAANAVLLQPKEKTNEEVQETRQERPEVLEVANVRGPRKMCPVCNKVPNYYFHRKNCKGV